jgi:sigma-B regulation protein RsbU (phosphoserine phosphatase)
VNVTTKIDGLPCDSQGNGQDEPETILVVDDSRAQRRLVCAQLKKLGYPVLEAGSGQEALEICRTHSPNIIVSDWMMPGMTRLELCKAYRDMRGDRYGYFILLTSKSEKGDIAQGLDVGADDFLTKPSHPAELRARIQAGQRILSMERELTHQNALVSRTLSEIKDLYEALDKDLIDARKLQQSLVRDRFVQVPGADISMLLQPAGRVGGDLVGAFPVTDTEVGFYSLDVSGHGVASALLTARLAGHLTGNSPTQNIAIIAGKSGPEMRSPAETVAALNQLIMDEIETEHYFTILLARANLATGEVTLCQAGHPHAVLQRQGGAIETPGTGGLPVGLIPGAGFDEFTVRLSPGDRLFLGSDGITECENPAGQMLEDEGLAEMMVGLANVRGPDVLSRMFDDLTQYNGDSDFADDVSGVLFEFDGVNQRLSA